MIVSTICGYLLVGIGVALNSFCRNFGKLEELTKKNVADHGKVMGKLTIPTAMLLATVAWPYALRKIYEQHK